MRSDAVSLEVPVKVHGSRLNDSALGATAKSEPFEEQTSTMIVFPQGGVLKMATPVTAGQMMVVTNLKSGHDSICRVVKVRAYGAGQSYVEVEFTHRQAGYWGVYFPSDGPDTTNQLTLIPPAVPAATPASTEPRAEKRSPADAPSLASVPKPPIAKSAGPADSVFAQIGSQEQVQPAASATSSRVKPSSIAEHASKHPDFETAVIDSLPVASSSPVASVSLGELQGDAEAAPALSFAGPGVPGEVADEPLPGSAPGAEHSAPLGHFATTLSASEPTQSKGNHRAATALSAAALILVATGAAYYFQWPPFGARSASKPAATIAAPAELPITAVTPQANLVPQGLNPAPPPMPANAAATTPPDTSAALASSSSLKVNPTVPAPSRANKSASEAPASKPTAATNPPSKVPDMFVALNAHPTSRAYSADSGPAEAAAPTVDSDGSDGELSAIASSSVVPPPSDEQEAPARIRVGGAIKPPRLVSSVLPVYPAAARETGIEGDVVIDTTIDKTGKVTGMKVVSGNAMLRQAALDALRQWKYEPSKLNGEAVPAELTVTIKFHRQ